MKVSHVHKVAVCFLVLAILAPGASAFGQSLAEISPAQKERLKSLAAETRQKIERQREELVHARWELFQAYKNRELDERRVKAALDRINRSQLDLLNIHLENQAAIRRILSEEQFRTFWGRISRHAGRSVTGTAPHEDGVFDRFPDKRMLDELNLTPEQVRRMKELATWPQRRRVMEDLRRNSRRMLELYGSYDLDTASARKLIEDIHKSQVELSTLTHKKQLAIRSILTAPQFEKYADMLSKRVQERRPVKRRH